MKKLMSLMMVFLVVSSVLVLGQEEDPCAGIWGSVKCFFWGNEENRAGLAWSDRGVYGDEALVGEAADLEALLSGMGLGGVKGEQYYAAWAGTAVNVQIFEKKDDRGLSTVFFGKSQIPLKVFLGGDKFSVYEVYDKDTKRWIPIGDDTYKFDIYADKEFRTPVYKQTTQAFYNPIEGTEPESELDETQFLEQEAPPLATTPYPEIPTDVPQDSEKVVVDGKIYSVVPVEGNEEQYILISDEKHSLGQPAKVLIGTINRDGDLIIEGESDFGGVTRASSGTKSVFASSGGTYYPPYVRGSEDVPVTVTVAADGKEKKFYTEGGELFVQVAGIDHKVIVEDDGTIAIDDWGKNTPLSDADLERLSQNSRLDTAVSILKGERDTVLGIETVAVEEPVVDDSKAFPEEGEVPLTPEQEAELRKKAEIAVEEPEPGKESPQLDVPPKATKPIPSEEELLAEVNREIFEGIGDAPDEGTHDYLADFGVVVGKDEDTLKKKVENLGLIGLVDVEQRSGIWYATPKKDATSRERVDSIVDSNAEELGKPKVDVYAQAPITEREAAPEFPVAVPEVVVKWDGEKKDTSGFGGDNAVYIKDGRLMLDCGTFCYDDEVTFDAGEGVFKVDGRRLTRAQVAALGENPIVDGLLAKYDQAEKEKTEQAEVARQLADVRTRTTEVTTSGETGLSDVDLGLPEPQPYKRLVGGVEVADGEEFYFEDDDGVGKDKSNTFRFDGDSLQEKIDGNWVNVDDSRLDVVAGNVDGGGYANNDKAATIKIGNKDPQNLATPGRAVVAEIKPIALPPLPTTAASGPSTTTIWTGGRGGEGYTWTYNPGTKKWDCPDCTGSLKSLDQATMEKFVEENKASLKSGGKDGKQIVLNEIKITGVAREETPEELFESVIDEGEPSTAVVGGPPTTAPVADTRSQFDYNALSKDDQSKVLKTDQGVTGSYSKQGGSEMKGKYVVSDKQLYFVQDGKTFDAEKKDNAEGTFLVTSNDLGRTKVGELVLLPLVGISSAPETKTTDTPTPEEVDKITAWNTANTLATQSEQRVRDLRRELGANREKLEKAREGLDNSKNFLTADERGLRKIVEKLGLKTYTGTGEGTRSKTPAELRETIQDERDRLITEEGNLLSNVADGESKVKAEEDRAKLLREDADKKKPTNTERYEQQQIVAEAARDAANAAKVAAQKARADFDTANKDLTDLQTKATAARAAADAAPGDAELKAAADALQAEVIKAKATVDALGAEAKNKERTAADADTNAEAAEDLASDLRWRGSGFDDFTEALGISEKWGGILTGKDNPLGYVFNTLGRLGDYKALSNLLVPEATQEWLEATNNAFFQYMDVAGTVTKEWCDYDDRRTADIPGESSVFIETIGGSYQFVGRIQAERSKKTFVLCEPINKTCPNDFVCRDDLCYADEDAREPIEGYLYKIDWGVTAPVDDKFTPYIDENGKAVKFNVKITYKGQDTWLYERKGALRTETIELANGESDKGTWLKYLENDEDSEACIIFSDDYYSEDRFGRNKVRDICTNVKKIVRGEVEYGTHSPSSRVSTGEVQETTVW